MTVRPLGSRGRRRHRPWIVRRDRNQISFTRGVGPRAHREFMWCLHDCREKGYEEIEIDLTACETAFPDGMLPLIAGVDALRREGLEISVVLPADLELERLFINTNWAHLLQPDRYDPSETTHVRHVAARRFADAEQQQHLVNEAVNVLLGGMTALQRDDLAALEWSINEITDNVLNHAQCELGGILQVSTFEGSRKVAVGVADSGIGILASLRQGHPDLRGDVQAIYRALEAGVTRHSDAGQGNGMAGVLRIATMSQGMVDITSRRAQIVYREGESRHFRRRKNQEFPGTFVYTEIGLDTDFHLSEALGFSGTPHRPVDVVEALYETDDASAVVLRLRDEAVGFGSRLAGRHLRTKCLNLMEAEPDKPLILDWDAVPLISSSFADELVGKLFADLGPLAFGARVRNVGMKTVVYGLIDKAITQRVVQVANGTSSADVVTQPELPAGRTR